MKSTATVAGSTAGNPSFSLSRLTMAAFGRFHCAEHVLGGMSGTIILEIGVNDETVVAFRA